MDSLGFHRFHFAFTIAFHYIFPQLTMGLGLLIAILRWLAAYGRTDATRATADRAATFWAKIFAVNFAVGVITGIPMEFQFGTNWSRFSERTGGVIGHTLAMEGIFAFFLESSFLYLLLNGKKHFKPRGHFVAALLVMTGSWLSGYFIIVTNAWMQHPVGHDVDASGAYHVKDLVAFLSNKWALIQYSHTMMGSVVTASFVMASIGAFYLLSKKHEECARVFVKMGVIAGVVSSVAMAMPTGDQQSKLVANHQPVTFAAMEGHYRTEDGAGMAIIGQPNLDTLTLDNPIVVPKVLSFMTYQRWDARIRGLEEFPKEEWPDNPALLYYAYHAMVGLGTLFIALMGGSSLLLWKNRLFEHRLARRALWALMLALPFPYIANTAGWMTAELGRQPWLVHGLLRTEHGSSDQVSSGNVIFSLLGFMGLDALLALLFFFLIVRIIGKGPVDAPAAAKASAGEAPSAEAEAA
ncbi:MAG: cytochrome ubiquinol oxidase subunit I [Polyangiaceae bacterium]